MEAEAEAAEAAAAAVVVRVARCGRHEHWSLSGCRAVACRPWRVRTRRWHGSRWRWRRRANPSPNPYPHPNPDRNPNRNPKQARAERSERAELQAELRRRADTKVARVALSEQMRLRNAHAAVERAALYPNHGGYARGGTPPRTAPLPTRSTPALGPRTALGPSTPPTSARGATGDGRGVLT